MGTRIQTLDIHREFLSENGKLSVMHFRDLPFIPSRIYWISEVNTQSIRGGHAHKELTQLFIVLSGSLNIKIWDGRREDVYKLDSTSKPLLVNPGFWRDLNNFKLGTILLVLVDRDYEESDYIRNKKAYLEWIITK